MAKHRKKTTSTVNTRSIAAAVSLGAGATTLAFAAPAHAADDAKWDCIAKYESGNANLSYGDADSTGYFQIQTRTWLAYGGGAYAPEAYQASRAQQLIIAEKVLAAQGPGAWATGAMCAGVGSWSGVPAGTNGDTTPAPPPPASTGVTSTDAGSTPHAAAAITWARTQLGKPYVWGGTGPYGYDCSGLVLTAWQNAGVSLPGRSTYDFWDSMTHVDSGVLRPGDLILWDFGSAAAPDHVTMYIGDGQMIESSGSRGGVVLSSLAGRGGRVMGAVRPEPNVQSSPTPAPAPAPAPSGAGTYTVKPGDYLSKIAKSVYGDALKWRKIYDANRGIIGANPNLIHPGQVLTIPK